MVVGDRTSNRLKDALRLRGALASDPTARMLHVLVLSLAIWYALWTIILLPLYPDPVKKLPAVIVQELGPVAALVLLRFGRFRQASIAYLAGTWAFTTLVVALDGGIRSPVQVFYATLPILATWLLGYRAAVLTMAVCLGTALVFACIALAGINLTRVIAVTPLGLWAVLLQVTLIGMVPVAQILRNLKDALIESRRTGEALREYKGQLERLVQELEALLREKSLLLKEVQHRVKNNLQVISSLAALQARQVGNGATRSAMLAMHDRVKSMSLIHEGLCFSGVLAEIDFSKYIQGLATRLVRSYATNPDAIRLHTDVNAVLRLDEATPCGLIVNEFLSNAIKYAFPDSRPGDIWITFRQSGDDFALEVRDNGVGLPPGFSAETSNSLGLQVVMDLAAQLGGDFSAFNEGGAVFRVRFRRRPHEDLAPVVAPGFGVEPRRMA